MTQTSEYQPIATAPKDGKCLLLLKIGYNPLVGRWLVPTPHQKDVDGFDGCWLGEMADNLAQLKSYRDGTIEYSPTYWMHLPKEPYDE